ncbi:uncharacterized protein LOC135467717 [Liolophura sinensis]|uniref:uncharacterized protein LOC135467717 n=1 Tax=Liolophura sinensis TaxID=3198878 RepID=UPI0031592426
MVRIVGSHHFANSGQIVPVMYPHLKKHRRDLRLPVTQLGSRGHLLSCQRPDDNYDDTGESCNIPNLAILSPRVIDLRAAETAVQALRVKPSTSGAERLGPGVEEEDVEMYEETDYPDHHTHSDNEGIRRNSTEDLERRLTCDGTESDATETQQTTNDDRLARKARRRQRNKLSAKAYRDRKRSKAQEQEQALTNLEAERACLLESVRKLQEEKSRFLQYLKSEMNIDITKTETDDVSMNMAES